MRTSNFQIISAGDMSTASIASSPVSMDQDWGVSIQAVFTGAPVGSLKLQASDDIASDQQGTGIVNWSDMSTAAIAVSAAGSALFDITQTSVRWIRLVYTKTSGTGSLTVRANVKGI